MSELPSGLKIRRAGAAVLLARVCRELKVRALVNAMVAWDAQQCRVSPGTLVVALILNVLLDRRPLYRVQQFYERRDLGLLFEEAVDLEALNDDALGRTLDRLAAMDLRSWFESVALAAVHRGQMEIASVHADTTSVSVYGEFEPTPADQVFYRARPGKRPLRITHGYSKQHRPDLKQFLCGLVVSKEGVPLLADIRDGNFADKIWNREMLEAMKTRFLDPRKVVYVADSSLITKRNLQVLAQSGVRFISRLPESFAAAGQVKARAFSEARWLPIGPLAKTTRKGATYEAASFSERIDGQVYRLVVVRSSALDKRKQKRLERLVAQEKEALRREIQTLCRQRFNCQQDAETALKRFEQAHSQALHRFRCWVIAEHEILRPRGRPRKDVEYPRRTTYRLDVELKDPPASALEAWLEREKAFVLITNLPESDWSDKRVLEEYKDQEKVEQGFRVYKHPVVADGIFLKSIRRVEAFAYVAAVALLVAAFLQYRVREELRRTQGTVRLAGNRTTNRPTSVALLEEINDILVLWVPTANGFKRQLEQDLPERYSHLLRLAGYGPEIYTLPLSPA